MNYLVIFHTFSGVMALERVMKKRHIENETMPAPRALSTDCGVALKFSIDNLDEFLKTISTENIHRIYKVSKSTHEMVFEND